MIVLKLLWPKRQGFKNQWIKASKNERILIVGFVCFGLLFWLGLSGLFWYFIKTFYAIEIVGSIVLRKLLELLMLSLFGLLCFSNIVTALSNFYLSEDLELLLSLPISRVELHLSRLLETMLQSSWMVLSLATPILISYGIVYQAAPQYYAMLMLVLASFIIIPSSLGVLSASILVSVFPARKIREALVLVGVLTLVFIFILLRWMKPERLASSENFESVAAYVAELQTPIPVLAPPQWASEVLLASLTGQELPLIELGLLLSGAVAMSGVGRWVTDWLYDDGRAKSQEARAARLAKSPFLDRLIHIYTFPLSNQARFIVTKDIKTFVRDPSQWTQLFLVASIVAIAIISVASLPVDTFKGPWMKNWINGLAFLILALVGFVMAALAARFQFSAVSNEGRGFWIVRTGPITASEFLWAKTWPGLFPMIVVGEGLALSSAAILNAHPTLIAVAMITALGLSFGLSGLAVGMGALYPDFKSDNASKLAASPAGMLYMILALALVFISLSLEAAPVFFILDNQLNGSRMTESRMLICAICSALLVGIWWAAFRIPLKLGAKKLWDRELPNG